MKEELLNILRPYHQEHLIAFWDELDERQQLHLAAQIKEIDLARVAEMYSQYMMEADLLAGDMLERMK